MAAGTKKDKTPQAPVRDLKSFFKVGVSKDYILIRDDFPMSEVSPGEFSRLCREMFQQNEEILKNGE